jgi:hypothetical protein
MRRVTWSVLTGLGVLLIAVAALFRFLVADQTVKFPLNEYVKTTLEGTNVSYFSVAQGQELSGVTMRLTNTLSGDVAAADAYGHNVAVWKSFTAARDVTNNAFVSYMSEQLAFDRKTGALVNCCGNAVGSHTNLHVSGQGFVWPINAQKQAYQVFDGTLLKPLTFSYTGTEVVDGVTTYKYVATVPVQQIATQSLPGSLVGMSAALVTLPEDYSATETYWVDPVTGTPIQENLNQNLVLKDSSGVTRLVLLSGDFVSTPASVSYMAGTFDAGNRTQIQVIEVVIPVAAGLVGLILLVFGLVLSRREPQDEYEEYEQEEPVGSDV